MPVVESDIDPEAVLRAIVGLEATYPGFKDWYRTRVIPGLSNGSRAIFMERTDGGLGGLAIAKRSKTELKLSTLWTDPRLAGRSTASDLGEAAFGWLGTRRPLFSIPDDLLHRYRPLLSRWEISSSSLAADAYRIGVAEHVFNGSLGKDSIDV